MANNYTTTSLDALKYLCSVINKTVDLPSTVISDTSVATNTTYSSFRLDKEFDTLEDELKHYTDTAIAGLNKLTKEIINDKALVVKDNVLYLYKADDDASNNYMQMMLINGVAVELGSTQVDMTDYYNKTDSDNKFAAKVDLTTLTTSFNDLKTLIGDTGLLNNATLMEDVQELYTGVDGKVDKTNIATTIDSTSTNTQVASAKAVYDGAINDKNLKTYTSLEQLGLTTPITVGEIFNAIPENSLAVLSCVDSLGNGPIDIPDKNGLLTIEKGAGGRCSILFKRSHLLSVASNDLYIAQLRADDGSGLVWNKVSTTITDVAMTSITTFDTTTITGSIFYEVINGVCYVYVRDFGNSVIGNNQNVCSLPKTRGLVIANAYNDDTGEHVAMLYISKGYTVLRGHFYSTRHSFVSFSYPVDPSWNPTA